MNDKYLSYLNFDTSLKAFLRAFVVTASEKGILNSMIGLFDALY